VRRSYRTAAYRVPAGRPRLGDIADILRPGMVLLVSKRGLFRRIVRAVTGSHWTHAALIDHNAGGIWIVIEAVAAGVIGQRLEHYFEDTRYDAILVRDPVLLGTPERLEVLRSAWLRVGRGYDPLGLLGILLRRSLGLPITTEFDIAGRDFCSEMSGWAFQDGAGLALKPGVPPSQLAPGDLADAPALRDVWRWPALP